MKTKSKLSKLVGSRNSSKISAFIAIGFALAFGGMGGYYIGSSRAASYQPLCLNSDSALCIQTDGSSQAYIREGATSRFIFELVGAYVNSPVYIIENESGNCLQGYNYVDVRVLPCDASKITEQWARTSTSPLRYLNVGSAKAGRNYYLGVPGPTGLEPNTALYIEATIPTYYYGWTN